MIRCESPDNPNHVRFLHRYDLGMRKWSSDPGATYTCSICISPIARGGTRLEVCNHVFHEVCLVKWLRRGSVTCPMCRSDLEAAAHESDSECDSGNEW